LSSLVKNDNHTYLRWGRNLSAVGEVSGADFTHLSKNILYRMSESLLARKADIEKLLAQNEINLMGLEEKIHLYDLTNSYLEGSPKDSEIAKRRHSKEKRNDCPLLNLALILDEDGFPLGKLHFPLVFSCYFHDQNRAEPILPQLLLLQFPSQL